MAPVLVPAIPCLHPVNVHREAFSPIPLPIGKFIHTENLSPLENTIFWVKFKLIISNQYKLNDKDLKLQKTSTSKFSFLFYNRLCLKFLVYC